MPHNGSTDVHCISIKLQGTIQSQTNGHREDSPALVAAFAQFGIKSLCADAALPCMGSGAGLVACCLSLVSSHVMCCANMHTCVSLVG